MAARLTAKQAQKLYRVVGNDPPKHKFNAKRTPLFINGKRVMFPSKAQAKRYFDLMHMQGRGEISALKREVPVDLTINGRKVCRMVWDAVYVRNNRMVYEDVKGATKTVAYRLFCIKRDLFLALFPNTVVIEVIGGKAIERS